MCIDYLLNGKEHLTTTIAQNHPPVPTASLPPLPSEFKDIPEESIDCWNSYYNYSFTSYFLQTEFSKSATTITTLYATPRTESEIWTWDREVECSTKDIGLTTLCDGVPRALSRERHCRTTPTTSTYFWRTEYETSVILGPTWTSQFVQPTPTCKVAPDIDPLCNRMMEAWMWRTSIWSTATSLPADVVTKISNAVPPCSPLQKYESSKPYCRMSISTWTAYYWPYPTPTGSKFCQSDWVTPTGTPTIPGKPNTAVVSGYTLTSPSVYLFYEKVLVETYVGYAMNPYSAYPTVWPVGHEVWETYSSIPANRPLTIAQMEEAILTASQSCWGRELDYCTMNYNTAF